MVVTNHQATKILLYFRNTARNGSFDFPMPFITPKLATIPKRRSLAIAPMWTNQFRTLTQNSNPQQIAVRPFVVNQPPQFRSRPATTYFWNTKSFQHRFNQFHFTRSRRFCHRDKWCSFSVCQNHYFCTFTFLFYQLVYPFFEGANVPSAKVSSHFKRPFLSNKARIFCQAWSKTPFSYHNWSRRQHVLPDGRCEGMSLYLAPLRRSHRMPSRQARLGAGSWPPFADRFGSGKSGSSFFHCFSVSSIPILYSFHCFSVSSIPILYSRFFIKCSSVAKSNVPQMPSLTQYQSFCKMPVTKLALRYYRPAYKF